MRLELESLLALADQSALDKGQALFEGGAVLEGAKGRNRLSAKVKGSQPFPYRVEINFNRGEWECTCPYTHGLVCKHVAAVALAALEAPEIFSSKKLGKQSPINLEAIRRLSDEELFRFLRQLEAERPELLYEFAFHLINRRDEDEG